MTHKSAAKDWETKFVRPVTVPLSGWRLEVLEAAHRDCDHAYALHNPAEPEQVFYAYLTRTGPGAWRRMYARTAVAPDLPNEELYAAFKRAVNESQARKGGDTLTQEETHGTLLAAA